MNGWDQNTGKTNHSELIRYVKRLTPAQLVYVKKDCEAAMFANPENPKNGYYQDLFHYCCMKQRRTLK